MQSPISQKTTVAVPSAFPVTLDLYPDGKLIAIDVQGVSHVVTHKDGSPLSKMDVDFIVIERMSYWSIAKKFLLTSV